MKGLRLYKKEKLCSTTAIDQLFGQGAADVHGSLVYPLRVAWRINPRRSSDAPVAFLISIPKRRLKHAVDRVQMRRRVREAYRLARPDFPLPEGTRIDLAFIYVANSLAPYADVDRAVRKLLGRISDTLAKL